MPKYIVHASVSVFQEYYVTAKNKEEAEEKVLEGEYTSYVDTDSTDFEILYGTTELVKNFK